VRQGFCAKGAGGSPLRWAGILPVVRAFALVIAVPGAMALVSAVVALLAAEWRFVPPFVVTGVVSLGVAAALRHAARDARHPDFREVMAGTALGWLVACLTAAVPIWRIAEIAVAGGTATPTLAAFANPWNAVFEAVSGFSTTGLTMTAKPSELPDVLLWWRSFLQWVGGAGIIVLVLAVVHPTEEMSKLFRSEAHEAVGRSIVTTVRYIWWIYLGYTAAGIVLLWLAGMTPWQALNYGMAAIATGGFAATDNSLADFAWPAQAAVLMITFLGATSFVFHARLVRGELDRCLSDVQLWVLLGAGAVGAAILYLVLRVQGDRPAAMDAVFQWGSALTTAGFRTTSVSGWSEFAKLLLIVAMIAGGATGSAAGGVKLLRVVTVARELWTYLVQIVLRPWLIVFRPATLPETQDPALAGRFAAAALMLVLWLSMILVASFILSFVAAPHLSLTDVVFDVTSALSIVGLSAGVVGPELHWLGKAVFILLMWMGRLEVLPVLVLIGWLAGAHPEPLPLKEMAEKEGDKDGKG
jgi:trk system potassium uptake protein TrkH